MARPSLRLRQGVDFNLQGFTTANNNHNWIGGTNGISYGIGDIVTHNNMLWVSTTAGNDDSEPAVSNNDWQLISGPSGNAPDTSHLFDGIVPNSIGERFNVVGNDIATTSSDGFILLNQTGTPFVQISVEDSSETGFVTDVSAIPVGTHLYFNLPANQPSTAGNGAFLDYVGTVRANFVSRGRQTLSVNVSDATDTFLRSLIGQTGVASYGTPPFQAVHFASTVLRVDEFEAEAGIIPVGYDPVAHRLVNAPTVRSGPEFRILSLNNANTAFTNFPTDPMVGDRLYNPHTNTIVRQLQQSRPQEFSVFGAGPPTLPVDVRYAEPFFARRGPSLPGEGGGISDFYMLWHLFTQGSTSGNGNAVRESILIDSLRHNFPDETINGQADVERVLNGLVLQIGDTGSTQRVIQLATPFHTNPAGVVHAGDGYEGLTSNGPGTGGSFRFYLEPNPAASTNAMGSNGNDGPLAGFPSGGHQLRFESQSPTLAVTQNVRNQTFYTFIGLDHISGGLADNAGWRREAFDDGIGR